ncbi:MAG: hypothetical protein KF691_00800 [Phycisphaeraceae bacterium]|nr:hypothetical protein [Phycisphaeraceae bacterium]
MRTARFAVLAAGLCLLASAASAQYAIKSHVIAGGGGQNASGGNYTLSGTIGETGAFAPPFATGGSYSHAAGFWWTIGACPADFNNDGFVDDLDFQIFIVSYNELVIPPANPICDLNGDNLVDDADFVLFVPAYNALVCP